MAAFAGAVKVLGAAVEQRHGFYRAGIVDAPGFSEEGVAVGVHECGAAGAAVDREPCGRSGEHHLVGCGEDGGITLRKEHGALRGGEGEIPGAERGTRDAEDVVVDRGDGHHSSRGGD